MFLSGILHRLTPAYSLSFDSKGKTDLEKRQIKDEIIEVMLWANLQVWEGISDNIDYLWGERYLNKIQDQNEFVKCINAIHKVVSEKVDELMQKQTGEQ